MISCNEVKERRDRGELEWLWKAGRGQIGGEIKLCLKNTTRTQVEMELSLGDQHQQRRRRGQDPHGSDLDGSGQGEESGKGGHKCALPSSMPLLIICMKLQVVLNRD